MNLLNPPRTKFLGTPLYGTVQCVYKKLKQTSGMSSPHQNKDMVSYQYMSWNCFLGTPQRCADPCKWCYHCKQYQLHTRQLLIPTSVRSSLSTFLHGTIVLRACSQMLSVLLSDAARFVSSTNKYRDFVNIDECATVRGHQLRKQADTTF